MSASDVETILMKYDIKDNGLFCYNDFLRHFVLTMKSREGTGTNLLGRQKQPSPKLQVCNRYWEYQKLIGNRIIFQMICPMIKHVSNSTIYA